MDVHSLNKAIAAAMHEVLPPGKTLMDGSYLDKESDAIRFVTWALRRLTPEQAARLPDMAETCVGHPIQSSLPLVFGFAARDERSRPGRFDGDCCWRGFWPDTKGLKRKD